MVQPNSVRLSLATFKMSYHLSESLLGCVDASTDFKIQSDKPQFWLFLILLYGPSLLLSFKSEITGQIWPSKEQYVISTLICRFSGILLDNRGRNIHPYRRGDASEKLQA